jgi:RNA polymerase sigma factor (sigma-70 family)
MRKRRTSVYILDFEPLVNKHTWNKTEDEKQVAWCAVAEAFATYDSSKNVPLPGYVASKAKFALLNNTKREAKRNTVEMHYKATKSDFNDFTYITVEKNMTAEALLKAIKKLPDKQRKVIIENIILEKSLTDIARETGITPQAVYNMRKRGLERLKKDLSFLVL